MGRKIILVLLLLITVIILCASCGDDGDGTTPTTITATTPSTQPIVPEVIYEVTGKSYKADMTTVNIAWDEDNEPTQYQKDTFEAFLKANFGESLIAFSSESSFTLSGTYHSLYDIVANDCDRVDNELFKRIEKQGNVDVVIEDGKISFLSDCFVNGWKMYFSIDYLLVK